MNHGRLHSRNWTLVLGCVAAIGALACASDPKKTDNGSGGAGGAGNGGAGGSGGFTLPMPGSGGQGGATGLGGTTLTGSGGTTTPVTVPNITCATDAECAASGLFCEPITKRCAQCTKTADCPAGGHCRSNVCVSLPNSCANSLECGTDKVCDPARGLCVQCYKADDCTAGGTCVANTCVAGTTACTTSLDCGTKVCDTASKQCVDCAGDNDCNAPGATTVQHCIKNVCKPECTSDKQCTPQGMLCNAATKVCAQCKSNTECPASTFCDGGQCQPDICDSTEAMCSGNGVASCNAAGSGWGQVSNCAADKPCKASGGRAACGGVAPPIDGGIQPGIDGGITPSDGPLSACTTASADPCKTSIAKYTGAQAIDGTGAGLCDVPSFVLSAQVAQASGKLSNYNNVPLTQFEVATVRVGWSATGFRAYIDVQDSSVQSVFKADPAQAASRSYQGDSIELFISSGNNLTGLTGTDNNTMHVIVPAEGPAVMVKTSNNGGTSSGTHTPLDGGSYKQTITSTGYALELALDWPGATPNAGAQVRFDLALNSADSTFGTIDDMRDGQMIYYVGTVNGNTTCQGSTDGTVPYCDDRTWCATTLQ